MPRSTVRELSSNAFAHLLCPKRAQASKLGGLEHYQGLRRKVVNLNQGTTNGLESVDIIIL